MSWRYNQPKPATAETMRRSYELQAPMWADLEMGHLVPDLGGRSARSTVRRSLVVVGEEDVGDIQESGRRLARDIRGARHAVIPAAAHAPMMERPAEFNELAPGDRRRAWAADQWVRWTPSTAFLPMFA